MSRVLQVTELMGWNANDLVMWLHLWYALIASHMTIIEEKTQRMRMAKRLLAREELPADRCSLLVDVDAYAYRRTQ